MRPAVTGNRRDAGRRPPGGGKPRDLVPRTQVLCDSWRPRTFDNHDAPAVGRPGGVVVERRVRREPLRLPFAVGPELLDISPLLAPGTCSWTVSVVSRRGAPPGRSMTYGLSSALNASRLPSGEGVASRICLTRTSPMSTPRLEPDEGTDLLLHLRGERDGGRLSRRNLDAPDLAAVRNDERLRVRRERRARHEVPCEAGLLVVALDGIDEPLLVPRG